MEKLYLIICLFHSAFSYKYLLIRIADGTSVGQNLSLNGMREFDMTMNRASSYDRKPGDGVLKTGKKSNNSEL